MNCEQKTRYISTMLGSNIHNKLILPMAASLEERSSFCCLCNFRALPLFDFGDGTDDTSKSSSSSVPESSCWDFLFLFDECVSLVRTGGLLSGVVLSEEDPPLRSECLFDERVSVVRTGGLLSCGVLCTEDLPPRAGLSSSSSVSAGEATSEFVGELGGCLYFFFF
jgi:hypothetical protein